MTDTGGLPTGTWWEGRSQADRGCLQYAVGSICAELQLRAEGRLQLPGTAVMSAYLVGLGAFVFFFTLFALKIFFYS